MEKVSFALEVENGWPPVAIEHVWCERIDATYRLLNAPFFIQGLAFGDRFIAEPDAVNGCIFEFSVAEESGHSLVWVLDQGELKLNPLKSELLSLGCSVEGFPAFNLHAVDVPSAVKAGAVSKVVSKLEDLGFAMAFPVWRHEPGDA